jgi:Tfp pilus assembly protein PilV
MQLLMSHKPINQKGFTAIETVLIVVILAIVGGTGYYVYQANNKSTDTQNAAHTATESAAQTATTNKSAAAAGAQAKLAYANLLKAFNKDGAAHQDWDVTYVDSSAGSKEFTKDFKAAVDNGTAWTDGVFCSDSKTFDSFTVSKTSLSGDTASVTLLPVTKAKSDAKPMQIKIDLQYSGGKWLVDKHECVGA